MDPADTNLLDILYTHLARARRRRYQRRPDLRRQLSAPVISIGNLTVGGSSKTPIAAEVARLLVEAGERPSILSRGYARRSPDDGVVVVSDGRQVLADVARAGDEPLMLAQKVPGAAVLVCPSRYLAGRVAETMFACTVHVLDDGFQHFELARDVDLLVAPDRLDDTRTLPFGRLREPLDAAEVADALLVECGWAEPQGEHPLGSKMSFEFSRRIAGPAPERQAFAFAGIARPERFFDDLDRAGWRLTGRRTFPDHHHYSRREIDALAGAAELSGAAVLLTTEKDYVRLRHLGSDPGTGTEGRPQIVAIPLEVTLAPAFRPWLLDRVRAAAGART